MAAGGEVQSAPCNLRVGERIQTKRWNKCHHRHGCARSELSRFVITMRGGRKRGGVRGGFGKGGERE